MTRFECPNYKKFGFCFSANSRYKCSNCDSCGTPTGFFNSDCIDKRGHCRVCFDRVKSNYNLLKAGNYINSELNAYMVVTELADRRD